MVKGFTLKDVNKKKVVYKGACGKLFYPRYCLYTKTIKEGFDNEVI